MNVTAWLHAETEGIKEFWFVLRRNTKYFLHIDEFWFTVVNRKRTIIYRDSEAAKVFGKHFKSVRNRHGMTQEELALEADVERATIGHLEAGRFNPTLDLIYVLAKALKVEVKELFDFESGK